MITTLDNTLGSQSLQLVKLEDWDSWYFSQYCKYGIFGGTPVDFMHVFKQGILKHCLSLFMDSLTDTQKAKLDSMAAYCYKNYCQTGGMVWQVWNRRQQMRRQEPHL